MAVPTGKGAAQVAGSSPPSWADWLVQELFVVVFGCNDWLSGFWLSLGGLLRFEVLAFGHILFA